MAAGMTTGRERRQAPRAFERVALAITDASTVYQADTKNISASGAYCTLGKFIAPMTKLQLQFELPDHARRVTVRCSGVVVRVEPVVASAERGLYDTAIFFTEISERHRAAISRFVQQRLAATSSPRPS